jgi:hypothetical protein
VAAVFVFDEEEMHAWAPSFVRYVYASVAALRSTIEVCARPPWGFSSAGEQQRAAERRHPTGRERMGSLTL